MTNIYFEGMYTLTIPPSVGKYEYNLMQSGGKYEYTLSHSESN